MTCEEQLQLWLKGKSVHNEERNECCPDFSCCKPEFLAPFEEREMFVEQLVKGDNSMLYMFLGRLINQEFPNDVYLTGR